MGRPFGVPCAIRKPGASPLAALTRKLHASARALRRAHERDDAFRHVITRLVDVSRDLDAIVRVLRPRSVERGGEARRAVVAALSVAGVAETSLQAAVDGDRENEGLDTAVARFRAAVEARDEERSDITPAERSALQTERTPRSVHNLSMLSRTRNTLARALSEAPGRRSLQALQMHLAHDLGIRRPDTPLPDSEAPEMP